LEFSFRRQKFLMFPQKQEKIIRSFEVFCHKWVLLLGVHSTFDSSKSSLPKISPTRSEALHEQLLQRRQQNLILNNYASSAFKCQRNH
jgi:hypothetical protein